MQPVSGTTYSFAKYGRDMNYWQPRKPKVPEAALETWYCYQMADFPIKDSDRKEVFSYQRQVRIEMYRDGKKSTFTLKFFHRDGEC